MYGNSIELCVVACCGRCGPNTRTMCIQSVTIEGVAIESEGIAIEHIIPVIGNSYKHCMSIIMFHLEKAFGMVMVAHNGGCHGM